MSYTPKKNLEPTASEAIGLAAEKLWNRRKPGESALALLDIICEPWRGYNVEFGKPDDYRFLPCGLARLMIEAFAPHGVADIDRYQALDLTGDDFEVYNSEVLEPFSIRYAFY